MAIALCLASYDDRQASEGPYKAQVWPLFQYALGGEKQLSRGAVPYLLANV